MTWKRHRLARSRFRAALCGLAALASSLPMVLAPSPAAAAAPDSWERLGDMTTGGTSGTATGGIGSDPWDDRIYYITGGGGGEVYDISDQTWTPLPATSLPQRCCGATVTGHDGRVYLIGGGIPYSYTAPSAMVEAYDPATSTWSRIADLDTPRASAAAAVGHDGRIYAMGGTIGYVASNAVEVYDPLDPDSGWQPLPPMAVARIGAFGATGRDGRIYAIGADTTAEAYNPATNSWSPVASMKVNRSYFAYAVSAGPDGRIYAMGGYNNDTGYVSSTEVYDPDTDTWTEVAAMPTARYDHAAALGTDGRIYALGGYGDWSSGNVAVLVEAYTPGPPVDPGNGPEPIEPIVTGPVNEYRTPDRNPLSVTAGRDGNVWFTLQNAIGRMTPDARITYFPLSAASYYSEITEGSDGNLWFTMPQPNRIGRITPDGAITEFPMPQEMTPLQITVGGGPFGITNGPDGNLWFTHPGSRRIGRITTDGAVTSYLVSTTSAPAITGYVYPAAITAASDGNLWFSDNGGISRITTGGLITQYATGNVGDLSADPDGDVWFTSGYDVGRINPGAADPPSTVSKFVLRDTPYRIAMGADGNLWATGGDGYSHPFDAENNEIMRIASSGQGVTVTVFSLSTFLGVFNNPEPPYGQSLQPSTSSPGDIAAAPGGEPYMWFTETGPSGMGRVDIRGEGAYSYVPGQGDNLEGEENCVHSGDASANFRRTNTTSCTIASDGPLTHISVSRDLNCQVYHEMDTAHQHYTDPGEMPPGRGGDGECGTFLATKPVGAVDPPTLFGPNTVPCWYEDLEIDGCGADTAPEKAFQLIEQHGVHGKGTIQEPYAIVTELRAGDMLVTQSDSYVVGRENYRTDIKVTNAGLTRSEALLTRSADCWLANSDHGGGRYTPETGAVACTSDPGLKGSAYTEPTSALERRIIEWTPISPGSHWTVGVRATMWQGVADKKPFPDQCRPASCAGENGAGINWEFTLGPGESATRSHYTTFSPFGNTEASIGDATVVKEPVTGSSDATFEVKLATRAGRAVTLNYKAVDGSASAATGDFTAVTGQVVFSPGETSKTVTVPVLADQVAEPGEDFHVLLTNPDKDRGLVQPLIDETGAPVTVPQLPVDPNNPNPDDIGYENAQDVLIRDGDGLGLIDDTPPTTSPSPVSIDDADIVYEPGTETVAASFAVSREGPADQEVSVRYATSDGSANAAEDYEAASGTVTFGPGESTKTIEVGGQGRRCRGGEHRELLRGSVRPGRRHADPVPGRGHHRPAGGRAEHR